MTAAAAGQLEAVKLLVADKAIGLGAVNSSGKRAADLAKARDHAAVVAILDHEHTVRGDVAAAVAQAEDLFETASRVHVLSTRYTGTSFGVAAQVKRLLELRPGVACFNPNSDNAIMAGNDTHAANAVWLKKWREMLKRAQETQGMCVQIVSKDEGLSPMQEAGSGHGRR
jgi:hypothetical protein